MKPGELGCSGCGLRDPGAWKGRPVDDADRVAPVAPRTELQPIGTPAHRNAARESRNGRFRAADRDLQCANERAEERRGFGHVVLCDHQRTLDVDTCADVADATAE